jgi:hypothetical protein
VSRVDCGVVQVPPGAGRFAEGEVANPSSARSVSSELAPGGRRIGPVFEASDP